MAGKMTPAERLTKFAVDMGLKAFSAAGAINRAKVVEDATTSALNRFYKPEFVRGAEELVAIAAAAYMAVPFPVRFILHEAVEDAIIRWLPEGSALRNTAVVAFPAARITIGTMLQNAATNQKNLEDGMKPTFQQTLTTILSGGNVDTTTQTGGGTTPPVKNLPEFIDALTLIAKPQRSIYKRLAELADEEQRAGVDKYAIVGIAAELRKATVEAVQHNAAESMNELISFWGNGELDRLGDLVHLTPVDFLKDPKTVALIGDLINDHYGRHGSSIPVAVVDRFDAFFNGAGVPEALRGPLKKVLSPGGIETIVDDVENVVYPSVLAAGRATYSVPVGFMSLVLLVLAVAQVRWVWLTSESVLSKAALSPAEYFMRWSGLGANIMFWFFVGASYLTSAIYVARSRPSPPSGKDEGDNAKEFDAWRRRYLVDIVKRVAVIAWSTSVLPVIIFVFGLVAMAWQFQWLTLVETVVVTVIAGHLLWPADDFAGLFLRLAGGNNRLAAVGHAATVGVPTRVHRITGTLMIVVLATPFLYAILTMVAPKFWTLTTMALTSLALGLAVILASRMLAGDSEDAPGDLKKTLAGQRVSMLKKLAPLIGVIGIMIYASSLVVSVAHNGYGWYKVCRGYEETAECNVAAGGFATYVDNTVRWEALRDRSVSVLAEKKEPVGDACNVATRKLAETQALYGPILYSDPRSDGNVIDLCKEVEQHRELLTMPAEDGKYPFVEIAKQCATKKAECGWWFKG